VVPLVEPASSSLALLRYSSVVDGRARSLSNLARARVELDGLAPHGGKRRVAHDYPRTMMTIERERETGVGRSETQRVHTAYRAHFAYHALDVSKEATVDALMMT
jgi:hypothetical protein